jgi:vanillate O-demethylase monooxygenase subunit
VDRWIDVRWNPPASMLLFAGATPTGRPRSEAVGLQVVNPHLFTPETARSTHYWFGVCLPRTAGPGAAEIVKQVVLGLREPFANEDTPMLEAQQASIADADFWSLRPVLLQGDAAAVRVRRLLDGLIKAERAAAA